MVAEEHWKEYASIVWEEFTKRSGRPERVCSPAEWWELRRWLQQGIPLRIVLRAMKDTTGTPGTLRYYSGPVQEAYEHWARALGGYR